MPAAPYQRTLFRGVPYWKDSSGVFYYYESGTPPTLENRIRMGNELEGTCEDWPQRVEARLRAYRAAAQARQRDGVQGQEQAQKS